MLKDILNVVTQNCKHPKVSDTTNYELEPQNTSLRPRRNRKTCSSRMIAKTPLTKISKNIHLICYSPFKFIIIYIYKLIHIYYRSLRIKC